MIQFYGIFHFHRAIPSISVAIARELRRRKFDFQLESWAPYAHFRALDPGFDHEKGDPPRPPPTVTAESIDLYKMSWGVDKRARIGLLHGFYPEAARFLRTHPVKVFGSVADAFPLPARWVRTINRMDVVYVPSEWCFEGYRRSGVDTELIIVPHGIEPEFEPPKQPSPVSGRLRFLSTWSKYSYPMRKGFDELLIGWREAFRPGDGCQLVLGTQDAKYLKEGLRRWCGEFRTEVLRGATASNVAERLKACDADIVVIPLDSMYVFQYSRFIRACHVGVFPSRGAFEMDPMKTIACGLVTVVTRATGPADYADDSNSLGIEPCGKVYAKVHDISHGSFPGISMDSFIGQLIHARDNYEELRNRFLDVNAEFRKRHAWSNALAPLMDKLEELVQKGRSEGKMHRYTKMNVGCGPLVEKGRGWLNIDLLPYPGVQMVADIRELEFSWHSFQFIKAHEVVEHFWHTEAREIVEAFFRWLEPGGALELKMPDCRALADRILSSSDSHTMQKLILRIYGYRGEHKWGYTPETVRALLEAAGFVEVSIGRRTEVQDMIATGVKPREAESMI